MTDHEQEDYSVPHPDHLPVEADLDNEVSQAFAAAQAEIDVEREPEVEPEAVPADPTAVPEDTSL